LIPFTINEAGFCFLLPKPQLPMSAQKIYFHLNAEDHAEARIATAAIATHWLEQQLPLPFLGAKPGVANAFVLLIFREQGLAAAVRLTWLRFFASQLLGSRLFSLGSALSLAGSLGMLGMLFLLKRLAFFNIGWFGQSLLMAQGHLAGQMLVAAVLFPWALLAGLWPWLSFISSVFALLTAYLAFWLARACASPKT
jgi:heptaprenyl diphosphate synthase